ncbi:MAG: M48 family metalloprotease [Salinivirgaceae bacterium]|nr:M48 family metalloprotease [Salinivirgaceae bacterium]
MKPFLIYIMEFYLCSGLFMLLYRWLIVKKPNYGLCRKYLIITMLLSAIIPALNVPLYPGQTINFPMPITTAAIIEQTEQQEVAKTPFISETVEEKVVAKAEELTPRLTLNEKFMYTGISIYLLVALVSLILIIRGIMHVSRLKRQADVTLKQDYQLAVSDKVQTPFSFWHTIFIRTDHDNIERSQIISHEASHIAHRHSIEKLVMTVLRSLFWFNPFVWRAEQRLEEVQEWQADRDALSNGYNVESYRLTIIKQLFGCNPELTLAATNSLTKTRFIKMKQKDFQGSKFLQTVAASALTLTLFLSFGCGQSTKAQTGNDCETIERDENVILTVDKFFDDIDETGLKKERLVLGRDEFGRIENGIEVFENQKNQPSEGNPTVTIAVNGIKTANSPTSKELSWVNDTTRIYLDGKRISFKSFKALKPKSFNEILYFREPSKFRNNETLAFVYVAKDRNLIIDYNYTVTIDEPEDANTPNLLANVAFAYAPKLFVYSTHTSHAALPYAKFAINGELVNYETFRQRASKCDLNSMIVYRGAEAEKRFGKGVSAVAELSNAATIYVRFMSNVDKTPYLNNKPTDYKEIADTIKQNEIVNKEKGVNTVVIVDGILTDEMFNELVDKCIDSDNSDVVMVNSRMTLFDNFNSGFFE